MPEVSVIIPTWNRAETLGKAIESVLTQTFTDFEILVCDDGSTDNSQEIVKAFSDPRIRWISGDRGGRPAIPRNRGIAESKSDWLAFLDSDDWWEKSKLEIQLDELKKSNLKASSTNAFRVLPGIQDSSALLNSTKKNISFGDLLITNQVICSSAVIHRSLLKITGGFPESSELKALEDYALWLRIATQTQFLFIPVNLVYYLDSPDTGVRSQDTDFLSQKKIVFSDLKEWTLKNNINKTFADRADATLKYFRNDARKVKIKNLIKKIISRRKNDK